MRFWGLGFRVVWGFMKALGPCKLQREREREKERERERARERDRERERIATAC